MPSRAMARNLAAMIVANGGGTDIKEKRFEAKELLKQLQLEANQTAASRYYGMTVRIDAGRYDDRLDKLISELRGELRGRLAK